MKDTVNQLDEIDIVKEAVRVDGLENRCKIKGLQYGWHLRSNPMENS